MLSPRSSASEASFVKVSKLKSGHDAAFDLVDIWSTLLPEQQTAAKRAGSSNNCGEHCHQSLFPALRNAQGAVRLSKKGVEATQTFKLHSDGVGDLDEHKLKSVFGALRNAQAAVISGIGSRQHCTQLTVRVLYTRKTPFPALRNAQAAVGRVKPGNVVALQYHQMCRSLKNPQTAEQPWKEIRRQKRNFRALRNAQAAFGRSIGTQHQRKNLAVRVMCRNCKIENQTAVLRRGSFLALRNAQDAVKRTKEVMGSPQSIEEPCRKVRRQHGVFRALRNAQAAMQGTRWNHHALFASETPEKRCDWSAFPALRNAQMATSNASERSTRELLLPRNH